MAFEHFGDGFSSVWASRLHLSLPRAGSNKTRVRVTASHECYSVAPWNSRVSKHLIYLPRTRMRLVTAVCLYLVLSWCTHPVYPESNHVQFPGQRCAAQHAGSREDPWLCLSILLPRAPWPASLGTLVWAAASSFAEKWLWANWNATSALPRLHHLSVILGQMACPAFVIPRLIICIRLFNTVRNSLILLRMLFSIHLQLQLHKMETQPIPLGNTMPCVGNHSPPSEVLNRRVNFVLQLVRSFVPPKENSYFAFLYFETIWECFHVVNPVFHISLLLEMLCITYRTVKPDVS